MEVVLYDLPEWNSFKAQVYALMLQAKRMAKDVVLKNGNEQVEWIIKRIYQFLPKRLIIFISEALMRKVIKYLYEKLKDYLECGD